MWGLFVDLHVVDIKMNSIELCFSIIRIFYVVVAPCLASTLLDNNLSAISNGQELGA